MNLGLLMKLLHVLAAFWFISGVVARDITFWWAAKVSTVQGIHTLLQVSDFFEQWAVIRGSFLVLIFGLLAAWLENWPIFGFLQGAPTNWLLVSLIIFVGSAAVISPLRLIPRRHQRTQATKEALAKGTITPQLTAALNDKIVNTFRKVELAILAMIVILMVTKPF
jgi:predicted integral membrane protein DUF2269